MADPTTPAPGAKPTPQVPSPPVAGGPAEKLPAKPIDRNSATALSVANGGQPGGKPRADGLKHGSPEAIKADREKARLAKAAQRARIKSATVPPALPAALPQGLDMEQAQGPDNLVGDVSADASLVPWVPSDLDAPLQETMSLVEEAEKFAIEGKLEKAHVPPEIVKEIMADCPWPKSSKQGIAKYGSAALAKGLNALGLSAKHKDVALILPSIAFLINDRVKLHRRLDELIKAANPPAAKAP